ncbi:hypothetical protein [Sphingobacterium siyangense]|jgi:hypothetical protein|uniref:hypothetical protein n=1 Tax=Sphingobacterium siyangense TaxID=459529 RepID=UPI003C71C7F0
MERQLPVLNLKGTDFVVDIFKNELYEKSNRLNAISIFRMRDKDDGYEFEYSPIEKNIPSKIQSDTITIEIPQLKILDPKGMCSKYNLETVNDKSDFEIMVDQEAFEKRVKFGQLPTIKIHDQIFYAEARLNNLRPKDNLFSSGINFYDIDPYFSFEKHAYIFPYNPKTKEFEEPNYETLKDYPKDLIVVEVPHERVLDPIGWNRLHGFDLKDGLKEIGLKLEFDAKLELTP